MSTSPKQAKTTQKRPIGIPTLEDKVLQRAVVMLLGPIYEQDFVDGSFGFRPGRSAHQALERLREEMMNANGGWILEVDISKFFDTLDHAHLREFVKRRVHDGVLLRLIGKWLNAGVMEDGQISHPDSGSPQGDLDLAALGERVPALCAGHVVPGGSSATSGRKGLPDPLRRRLCHRLHEWTGRATRDGSAAEAIRAVRPETPPDEDAADSVPEAQRQGQIIRGTGEF